MDAAKVALLRKILEVLDNIYHAINDKAEKE